MKLKKLKLKNFANFTDFEIEFNENITRLVGFNGSGKTTIGLTAIWAGLKGIAEKSKDSLIGERFRFIGPGKASSDIEIILKDEIKNVEIKVKNHITNQTNNISFKAPDGYKLSNDWINNLLSVAFLSAKNFTMLNSKEQALLLGIDTSDIDEKIKKEKDEFTLLNRDLKNIGEVNFVEKFEKVSISELLHEKQNIEQFNSNQDILADDIMKHEKLLSDLENEKNDLLNRLELLEKRIENGKEKIKTLQQPEQKKDLTEIINKIENAEDINIKHNKYLDFVEKSNKRDGLILEIESNKKKQSDLKKERIDFIKSFHLPYDGLEINDKGELLLNSRPIKEPYFSKGELELIVARLYKSKNPELKLRFIDDFELLDENNQEKIITELINDGFQVITAEVGEKSEKENVIILRECTILNGNQKNNLI
jgi:DNA repair exonuclease SbcCD ATPase subunit